MPYLGDENEQLTEWISLVKEVKDNLMRTLLLK